MSTFTYFINKETYESKRAQSYYQNKSCQTRGPLSAKVHLQTCNSGIENSQMLLCQELTGSALFGIVYQCPVEYHFHLLKLSNLMTFFQAALLLLLLFAATPSTAT